MLKPLIFLVEDDFAIRDLMKEILEMHDFQVEDFENGKHAVERLDSTQRLPDMVFLDLMMPVMNGWEFLKVAATKLKWSTVPIVVFSAAQENLSLLAPAAGFYQKPVDIDEFLSIIEKHLRQVS